ncbi:XRN 5'-3' exonuclease N-terminus-domain-containing protein [Boeremia exigua]|uniref:XRN 5'-3' exonuclease N-terminus-domain-containing protein n=1 Tax=Boeremia exigua TaxID=749465 RepID=UPI001E8CB637|nr:XRN 5'-3' exonuclease N-terminus-domain-containing protein [Boeremia exigua]KAH6632947.1 XRN 5'-3' exonuclease N-terminus-domain-containing protein [Boeremia exigua]
MGVPAMFRWLSQKYPKIVSSVVEDQPKKVDGTTIPVDRTTPNPNGEEFDNLYLDMNGIVHPCSHPDDGPAPRTEADMMVAIFEYTDRVVGMVRPRKLLYMAVDGVAPRAKMNQQRSRRFRSAKEAAEKDAERAEFVKMLTAQKASRGEDIHSLDEVVEKTWDSNAITPGTPFMHMLAESLQYWCAYKFTTDPSWKDMKVIISDASVPGEGEHKIMNFVRSQRAMPTHDPNTSHVIYGLDADLIMLSLATHEPRFRVLREDVFFDSGKDKVCTRCGRKGHIRSNCEFPDDGKKLTEEEADEEWASAEHAKKPYIWLHTGILREYLAVEMDTPKRTFAYDLERSLDDWVFMCFFVGNDFLPHLPSLEIRDQGIDLLISIWRDLAAEMDDYVTKDGFPDMRRVQQILTALAGKEADIFKKRKEVSDRQAARRAQREGGNRGRGRGGRGGGGDRNGEPPFKRVKEDTSTYMNSGVLFFAPQDAQSSEVRSAHKDVLHSRDLQTNKSAAARLKELMKGKDGEASSETVSDTTDTEPVQLGKRKAEDEPVVTEAPKPAADEPLPDTIMLWEPGYEERYYQQKFHVAPDDIAFRNKVARQYAEGLCWVLAYYMQGCPSWTWYFPHHYAPFAADFVGLEDMDPKALFEKGTPFHPYEQLMGVLPAASNHAIPEPFRVLMEDPDSPIVDFYPEDFPIDLNGKKFAWQGVAVLPFIDEKRLLAAMATKYPELSPDEKARNEFGKETLMFSAQGELFPAANTALYRTNVGSHTIDPATSAALHGAIEKHDAFVPDATLTPPFDADGTDFEPVQDGSMRVFYEMPSLTAATAHKSVLLAGVKLPFPALSEGDKAAVRRNQDRGGRGGYRGRGGGGFGDRGRGRGGYGGGGYNNGGGGGYDRNNNGGNYNNGGGNYNNNNNNNGYNGNYNDRNGSAGNGGGYAQGPPGFPQPFTPGAHSWPAPPPLHNGVPPPPPGWVPPPGFGAPGQGQYGQQQQPRGPPPGLGGRDYNGGGRNGGGGAGYGGNPYSDRQRSDRSGGGGGRGGRGGGGGNGGGYGGGRNGGGGGGNDGRWKEGSG